MSEIRVDNIGIPTKDELQRAPGIPTKDRLLKGPVAVIECFQDIPCDVCEKACPFGAIKVGDSLTNLPILDEDKCIGCGNCIPKCPGLAIFVVDLTYSEKYATVSFPYEFLPLPKPEDEVYAVDRKGKVICKATVEKAIYSAKFDRTYILTIRVPKEYAMDVRFIRLMGREI